MKWAIENVEEQHFIRIVLSGDFSLNDMSRAVEELFSSEFWKSGTPVLFDETDLNLSETSLEVIRDSSNVFVEHAPHYGNSKIAVLAGSITDFARGRQFELLAGNKVNANIRIFMEEREALNWLNN